MLIPFGGASLEFLILDDHVDNRFLLTKTLLRKFPAALLQECQDSATAITAAKRATLTAAVVHRAADVDDNPDNRYLLAKTLIRRYPSALVQECQDSTPAMVAAERSSLTAAVVHRASDVDGLPMVEMIRKARPLLPILFVSGADLRAKAFEAGATAFLNYDAWLRVGVVVEEMLQPGVSAPPFAADATPASSQ
jgi:CheY-like chemotaxis protein